MSANAGIEYVEVLCEVLCWGLCEVLGVERCGLVEVGRVFGRLLVECT